MAASPACGVQVIARAGQVLRTLDLEDEGLSLAQLAERIGLARSTMHRIVTALATEGMLATASTDGRVRAGPEFARLACPYCGGKIRACQIDPAKVLRDLPCRRSPMTTVEGSRLDIRTRWRGSRSSRHARDR